jgi:ribosomal protein S18 acetylase RimI-like enzyme
LRERRVLQSPNLYSREVFGTPGSRRQATSSFCCEVWDQVWCAYLADLAVDPALQRSGIGRRLVELTRETLGDRSMLLLLSVPEAMGYYPKIGMEPVDNAFIFYRRK